jgi:hypothetical protein
VKKGMSVFTNQTFKFRFSLLMLLIYLSFDIGIFVKSSIADPPQSLPPQSMTYRSRTFNPGDAVQISVYPDTSSFLHDIYSIDGNGNVYLPIKGKVKISEMSKVEFESYLKQNYTSYLRYPEVQVRPLIRVSLLGGFARPGLYYVDPDYSMWDLVRLAGGTLREDGLKKMKWERDKDVVQKNLIPYYESGNALWTIGFRSGDQIWTPTPRDRTFWTTFRDISLIITTAVSLYFAYVTIIYIQSGRYAPGRTF